VPANTRKLTTLNEVNYALEHVLATLLNDVLYKYHQRSNLTTRDNIEYVLARQTVKHWRLGDCDFTRYFHYKWENENGLLGPLFSIAQPFDVPYVWTFDTQTYPWTLNLKAPSTTPSCEIRFGKNLAEIERSIDPSNIVNRLYALGYGEGVNQLTIEKVNGGRAYIENTASIAEYGLGQYVWVDRRFEDAATLLASAKAFLEEWSVPRVNYRVKAVDLSSLTGLSVDKFTVGKVVRIIDPDVGTFTARIVSEKKPDIYGAPGDIELEIANTKANLGTSLADVERRQEINEVYAQGATNIDSHDYCDNADPTHPAVIRFYLPDELVRVNKLELTYQTEAFRTYSKATRGGGSYIKGSTVQSKSTASGGGTSVTSSSGGGQTTSSGGGQTTSSGGGQTSSAGGDRRHVMFQTTGTSNTSGEHVVATTFGGNAIRLGPGTPTMTNFETLSASGNHTHTVANHTHTVSAHTHAVSDHTHSITLQPHSHAFEVEIPAINIPDHTHEAEHGIYTLDRLPTSTSIKVDGKPIPHTAISGENIDLIPFLAVDSENRVVRGWHTVEITPNDLARITAQITTQFFMQSRGGVDV